MADDIYPPPDRSVYNELPEEVRRTMLRSFQDRKDGIPGSNENLANRWDPPLQSFWDCVDRILDVDLNMIVMIYQRIVNLEQKANKPAPFWQRIKWIKNMWVCSSAGFNCIFYRHDEMPTALDGLPSTCRDTSTGGYQHQGSNCWREISEDGWALHLLLGKKGPDGDQSDQIHIDWIGPAEGRIKGSLYCDYDYSGSVPHLVQVNVTKQGEPSPFYFVEKAIQQAIELAIPSGDPILIESLIKEQKDWERDHRRLACQGRRGWDEGNERWKRVDAIKNQRIMKGDW